LLSHRANHILLATASSPQKQEKTIPSKKFSAPRFIFVPIFPSGVAPIRAHVIPLKPFQRSPGLISSTILNMIMYFIMFENYPKILAISARKIYSLLHQAGVRWCMPSPVKRGGGKPMKSSLAPRASVTFPLELYKTLEQIAKQQKVSIAWVVRDAAEKYVADKWPLLNQR
jgi:hypothetical protein